MEQELIHLKNNEKGRREYGDNANSIPTETDVDKNDGTKFEITKIKC